jgi:hypothetical protein
MEGGMEYAIHTLEIEIGRIRVALRKARETHIPYEDTQEGFVPDFQGMMSNISEMEKAIKVLKEWVEAQPKSEGDFSAYIG